METWRAAPSQKGVIGPERPFIIIGERLNPTRRKRLLETLAAGDFRLALREAQAHPEQYRNLVVKVAGYSARFSMLDKELQDQIIARTTHSFG